MAAPTDWEFVEMEAMRFGHYTLGAWLQEHHEVKARVIAHFIEHGWREEYAAEKIEKAHGAPAGSAPTVPGWASSDYQSFRQPARKG